MRISSVVPSAVLVVLVPALALAGLAPVLAGCAESNGEPRTPVPGTDHAPIGGQTAAPDMGVIDHIATATCDREQSCGTIGPGAYFASREVCMQSVRDKYGPKLSFSMCPGGLDDKAVNACVESLKANECSTPGDTIARMGKCSASDLCMK